MTVPNFLLLLYVTKQTRKKVIFTDDTIAQLLNIVDKDSSVTSFYIEGNIKHVELTKNIDHNKICPLCGSKLNSKGLFKRHPKNQVLQDGYVLELTLIGRRWKCSNKLCNYTCSDEFDFVEPRKQVTKIIDYQIIQAMKDTNLSCVQVARMFKVSDTYVHQVFMQYVNLPRLPLTKYVSVDEVYLNISNEYKYALVIMDFQTGEILDLLPTRRKFHTESYFLSIPKEERDKVEYLICDMYNPYINYTKNYFLHSVAITDSFHVLQWLLKSISAYIKKVKKRYTERDKQALKERNKKTNCNIQTLPESTEVFILNKASWVLLQSSKHWEYIDKHKCDKLNRDMDTYDWENAFLDLDKNFRTIRNLKELYEEFNDNYINDLNGASKRLDELIDIYNHSELELFRDFSKTIKAYRTSIINSFTYVINEKLNTNKGVLRRLSNGPMESFNNIPSSLRSQSHGISNFDFLRNRILWAVRDNAAMQAVPLSKKEIHTEGKKRGSYKK